MKVALFASDLGFLKSHGIYDEMKKEFTLKTFDLPNFKNSLMRRATKFFIKKCQMINLMKWADVSFFEWADDYLIQASNFKSKHSKIITRLHRYELYAYAHKIDWSKVDKIILVSEGMKYKFLIMFPDLKNKVIVIPSGVNMDEYKIIPRKENDFISLGTLSYISPIKRTYDLILAFNELVKIDKKNKYLLRIGGKGLDEWKEYHEIVKKLVTRLNLNEQIIFDGYISDIKEWYNNIDIFINNSYDEGYSLSLQEALASGCYPLVHGWEGADEYVPKDNIFFTSGDLVEKIQEYSTKKQTYDYTKVREMLEKCDKKIVSKAIIGEIKMIDGGKN